MRALLDVNVLVALLDPEHVKHVIAYDWFDANLAAGWASCPLTENGCLRVMTSPRYPNPKLPAETLARLERSTAGGNHAFWPDDVSITDAAVFDWDRLQGHQQVTDIYLLALAVAHVGRLVTFDQRIQPGAVKGSRPEHLVTL